MTFSDIMTGSDFDIALGGMGDDLIDFTTLPQDQISALQSSGGVEAIALFGGNDNISGSDDSTIIFGNKGNDTILGNGGDDTLLGGMDNDQIQGGAGNDNINGDLGDDTLSGGAGTDILTGRDGADIFVLTQGEDTDTITDFVSGVDRVQLPDGLAESDVTIEGGEIRVTATGEILAQVNGAIASGDLIVTATDDGGGPPTPDGGLLSRRLRSTNPLNEALQLATTQLASFADTPEFAAQIQENFGNVNIELAESLIVGLTSGENRPPLEVRSAEELGTIEGGYDAVTGTIYLNENLLSAPDPQIVASIILEEWGHHIDAQLNESDRVGDEGAEFAMRVRGQILDAETLDALRSLDDSVSVNLDGQVTDLETGEYSNRWYINIYDWSSGNTERVLSGKLTSNRRSDGKTGFFEDWQSGSPNRGVGSDYFMNQMWTQDDFQAGQTYNFKIRSDDGFRIAAHPVNGGEWQFITPWSWQTAYGDYKNYTFTPKQSGEHWLYVLQYEKEGLARLDLFWEKQQPDLDIRLDFFGNFTQSQKNQIEKAAQNWERIITKDMTNEGVLNISVYKGDAGLWAETNFPPQYPVGVKPNPGVRYNLYSPYDNQRGVNYHTYINFDTSGIQTAESRNLLVRLAMHELGHALYLDEAQNDSSLGLDSVMDLNGLDAKITEGVYKELERLGYGVNRNAGINWYA